MSDVFSVFIFVGLIISILASGISIPIIVKNREKYGLKTIPSLMSVSILFNGIVFSLIYYLSTEIIFTESINLALFYFTIIFETISLLIYCFVFSFLRSYGHPPVFLFLLFNIILSLIVGTLLSPQSIDIEFINNNQVNFSFSLVPKLLIILINLAGVIYNQYKLHEICKISNNKDFCYKLILFTAIVTLSVIIYCFYILYNLIILRSLFILMFWISVIIICYLAICSPKLFLALTNKIFFINIYHKTGVLLYSYKFEKSIPQENDSSIWGNILIGLNHILSEFINKEDQIDVLQTKNAEIVVNYNNDLGFAVLAITNQTNSFINQCLENLTQKFKEKYQNELNEIEDINKIINVSEFEETNKIIEEYFKIFI
ncbi:MAG: hypothetical protein R6U15_03620 [Candidatus Izemoplasmatales bacterium]